MKVRGIKRSRYFPCSTIILVARKGSSNSGANKRSARLLKTTRNYYLTGLTEGQFCKQEEYLAKDSLSVSITFLVSFGKVQHLR